MNENTEESKPITEEEDYGCIELCLLTDVLHETLAGLIGGYDNLALAEEQKENPDKGKIKKWSHRAYEISLIRRPISIRQKTYEDMRKWIDFYSKELKNVDQLRGI